jgi:hypothetical protein
LGWKQRKKIAAHGRWVLHWVAAKVVANYSGKLNQCRGQLLPFWD